MARILTMSSLVARGHVGNSATTFPLQLLGHDVVVLPTVILAHHPGHARGVARTPVTGLDALGRDALRSPRPHPVDGMLLGYLAEAEQAKHAAALVSEARTLRSDTLVLLDPVCGDAGALYVDREVVQGFRDLLPLADVATPNVTELAALAAPERMAEALSWGVEEIAGIARRLGPRLVVVTSAPGAGGCVGNLVVTADAAWRIETPRVSVDVHGTGDLLSGLILDGLLTGCAPAEAVALAAGRVHDVLVATARLGRDELALSEAATVLLDPHTTPPIEAVPQA